MSEIKHRTPCSQGCRGIDGKRWLVEYGFTCIWCNQINTNPGAAIEMPVQTINFGALPPIEPKAIETPAPPIIIQQPYSPEWWAAYTGRKTPPRKET